MGISLKDQLRQLEEDAPKSFDPEAAYSSLDSQERKAREGNEGREHYVDVGPSRLRAAAGADAAQTLLTDKYGGKSSSRMKIFDDDEEDEDNDEEEAAGGFDDEEDEDDDDEDEEEDEDDEEEEDEDEDEEDDEEDEDEEDEEEDSRPAPSGRALDPMGALRESRLKDIEKGRGIKRQKDLFDTLLTLRITFQKALPAAFKVPGDPADVEDPAGEIAAKRVEALKSLGALNEKLFALREGITLPGTENPRKRRRADVADDEDAAAEENYWTASAADSLALVDAAHPQLVPVLNKWSTKIHAASLQLGKSGGSKFLQSTRGAVGVVDAIDSSLGQRRDAPKPLLESEEQGYRALLREVIESRQGMGVDLSHLRREKKKKREAERGGSKGRKLRYTVHDKAANFVVPVPLAHGWHEEQVDELFSSLFGGIGLAGAMSTLAGPSVGAGSGMTDLGGLKVF